MLTMSEEYTKTIDAIALLVSLCSNFDRHFCYKQ